MVEIFRTNVNSHLLAQRIIDEINSVYNDADVSFDLEDCDHILRVCVNEEPEKVKATVISLFNSVGCLAIALDDECVGLAQENTPPYFYDKVRINTFLGFF